MTLRITYYECISRCITSRQEQLLTDLTQKEKASMMMPPIFWCASILRMTAVMQVY
jgi:hypothetical protein